LIDVRLVNYILAIPPVPWCSDKHILRESMRSILPESVLGRPKTGLAGDPVMARVRASGERRLAIGMPPVDLDRFVAGAPHVRLEEVTDANTATLDLRPLCLGRWLAEQGSTSLPAKGGARGTMFSQDVAIANT
jgi:asparagine synthase (glutamine-hydrolysing)